MLLVIGMGTFVAAVILERWWYFGRTGCDAGSFAGILRQRIRQGRGAQALELCSKDPSPVARVAEQVLRSRALSREDRERGVQIAASREIVTMQRGLSTIAAMQWLAPALATFAAAIHMGAVLPNAVVEGVWDTAVIASGLSDSLIALGGGLLIASLAIVFHHLFAWKIETRRVQMDSVSQALFEAVSKHGFPNALANAAGEFERDVA
jgi:biopolymer transport protein ExbB